MPITEPVISLVVRRDYGAPRIGFWHRNEITPIEGGGMRMTKIPDEKGPDFTTICTFNYFEALSWPERIINALRKSP